MFRILQHWKQIYLRQSSPILHVVLKVLKRPMPATSHNWWLIGEPSKMTWTKVRIVPNCANKWCEVQISTSGWRTYEPSKMARLALLGTWMKTGLHVLLSHYTTGGCLREPLVPFRYNLLNRQLIFQSACWLNNKQNLGRGAQRHMGHMDLRQRLWDFTLCMYIHNYIYNYRFIYLFIICI